MKRVYIETYGCQMNVADSELIAGVLRQDGFAATDSPGEADVILVNTCAVRDHAEQRVVGRVGELQRFRRPGRLLVVVGCMAQLEAEIEEAEQAEDVTEDIDLSLSAMAERMAADPRVAGALKRAGLAPREAATMQMAFLQVAFAVGFYESGTIKEIPKDVNPENVKFYQANRAEIATLTALGDQGDE